MVCFLTTEESVTESKQKQFLTLENEVTEL